MKVCKSPIPYEADYSNFDFARIQADEDRHRDALKAKLVEMGYDGKRTGDILRVPMADSFAAYMLAHKGRKSCLIHLPYGDAWNSPDVRFLPLTEVLRRIDGQRKLDELFAAKTTKA